MCIEVTSRYIERGNSSLLVVFRQSKTLLLKFPVTRRTNGLFIWGEVAQLAGLAWLMPYFLEIFSLCLRLVADLFATLRLRGKPGRDGCQSALWDCFGGRIFNMAANSSHRTVPPCTLTTIFDPVSSATLKWRINHASLNSPRWKREGN